MRYLAVLLLLVGFAMAGMPDKSVFVSGNNQAAQTIRKKIASGKSCFILAEKNKADSILEIAEDRNGWPLVKVSGTLTSQSGEVIWSHTRGAAEGLFADMKKSVCTR